MAFDIVGDIAILKKPLKYSEEEYVRKIVEKHKGVRTILLQETEVEPPYRIARYRLLYGENRTETIAIEYGLKFKVDVARCYYSSRLSNERYRIARNVKDGEDVLVMFSGVNPYSIYISKFSKARTIYSVELNPFAVKYGLENVRLNKANNVITILGDVRDVVPYIEYLSNSDGIVKEEILEDTIESSIELNRVIFLDKIDYRVKAREYLEREFFEGKERFKKKFDRIIMPLPKESDLFLEVAIPAIKDGGIIHLYHFLSEENYLEEAEKILEEYSNRIGFEYEILGITRVGDISPGVYRFCIDFKVKRT
ncbi:MAG: hypothetical protein BXU00_00935 [Candidatus Nanoclepta minutus]|uniref:SAM-dependent methyltransferase TRM5/TYW2-type domain-containing protein n=1 Tax=Candidatus Nanoclepta minutus TaxID=1940235 RepID=A0A397WP25_9ARCH|nr:MAG: hypothetical protein BXU00_00935 [Candidatus Nanoclepta minutus]